MDQFDVNGDGVLGRGEINLWRNHFKIRDELNQDDYRTGSNNKEFLSLRISGTHKDEYGSLSPVKDSCLIHLVVLLNQITASGLLFKIS